jgi:transitional endoplasmic reticulum ATPase
MNKNQELIQALRAALETSPGSAPLYKHLAELLIEAGDLDEAAQAYRQALDVAPDDGDIRLALADVYRRQGEPDVALAVLERLMKRPDPSAQALILAARLYLETENLEQAAQAYRQAIATDPDLADPDLQAQLTLVATESPAEEVVQMADDLIFVVASEDAYPPNDLIERPRITFEDVGGMDELKEEIRMKIIYPMTHPEIYQAYGKRAGGGILMYGPPGCGKTYLARATAGQVKARFISVGLHDVLDMYIGQSEQNLHAIFELARRSAPCVLFFDEVDALGASRSDMRYSAGRKVINQFLAELDGVDASNEGVLILAATNAPWHVDPAIRRPGRFDRVIFVPPPDEAARAAILRIMLADKPTRRIDADKLSRMTKGFSGADLKGVVDKAVEQKLQQAMRSGLPEPLTHRDLQAAAKSVRPTIKDWLATARNYAIYANQSGLYDDILSYLNISGAAGRLS